MLHRRLTGDIKEMICALVGLKCDLKSAFKLLHSSQLQSMLQVSLTRPDRMRFLTRNSWSSSQTACKKSEWSLQQKNVNILLLQFSI